MRKNKVKRIVLSMEFADGTIDEFRLAHVEYTIEPKELREPQTIRIIGKFKNHVRYKKPVRQNIDAEGVGLDDRY